MTHHQGLGKAAEEKSKGLAKDEPLRVTPESRGNLGGAHRPSSLIKLFEAMDDECVNAARKIASGRHLKDDPGAMRSCIDFSVGGGVADSEVLKAQIQIDYERWFNHMGRGRQKVFRDVCISIVAMGMSFTDAGRMCTPPLMGRTAKAYAILACKEYVKVNKKELPRVPRPVFETKERCQSDFKATRVVEFID